MGEWCRLGGSPGLTQLPMACPCRQTDHCAQDGHDPDPLLPALCEPLFFITYITVIRPDGLRAMMGTRQGFPLQSRVNTDTDLGKLSWRGGGP